MVKKFDFWRWAAVATRCFLGILFFTAGMGKLTHGHFWGLMGPIWLEDVLAKYGLGLYARFIAYSQVVVGLLLLSQRFATLGAVMLLPMIANILMITISQRWTGTPYVNAVFLAMNIYLLVYDFHRLKFLVSDNVQVLRPMPIERKNRLADALLGLAALLLVAGAALFNVQQTLAWGLIWAGLAGIVALLLWQGLFSR